jgi:hypothetical protein
MQAKASARARRSTSCAQPDAKSKLLNKKSRGPRSAAAKKKKARTRVRHRAATVAKATKPYLPCPEERITDIKFPKMLHTQNGCSAILLKSVFSLEEMATLAELLTGPEHSKAWQWREDLARGPKHFFITGFWTEQGHCRPKEDVLHRAGKAGKRPASIRDPLHTMLQPYGEKAAACLRRYRPDLFPLLDSLPKEVAIFSLFPLFMATLGVAQPHLDRNDLIAVLMLVKSVGRGGALELIGLDSQLSWQVGDAIVLDSAKLVHGTRPFSGKAEDRIVGLFIVHKTVLRICGLGHLLEK